MPITEFAALTLVRRTTPTMTPLPGLLKRALHAMQSYTSNPSGFAYFGHDDWFKSPASTLYILGSWTSLEQHMEGFIPSAENQELLKLMQPHASVSEFFHVDCPGVDVPRDAKVLVVERMRVGGRRRGVFEEGWESSRKALEQAVEGRVGAGWRIEQMDGEVEMGEWVVFSGWASREAHVAFMKSEKGEEYQGVRDLADAVDVMHLIQLGFT